MNKLKNLFLRLLKSTRVSYPSTLMIELTNHCNLHCITCPREHIYGKQMDIGSMNFEQFKIIIDEVSPYLDSLGLTGLGETLLYKDLIRAVQYVRHKNKGIIISISLNAHLKNFKDLLLPLIPLIDTIQVSIDGIHEIYEKVRVNARYDLFHQNVKTLVKLVQGTSTDIMLNMVVVKENFFQIADIIHFAHQEGIRYVNVTPLNLVSLPELAGSYLKFFESVELNSELEKAYAVARTYPEIEFTCPNFKRINTFNRCHYPWGHFYITWDGYMPPCCAKPFPKELNFGNVFEQGILNVLNSKKFQHFRTQWLKNTIPSFCQGC